MQMQRLFEMVYLLIERGTITAAEFAERFEISVRTVYRDIDTLSGAGIPVYASRGKGGGIRLLSDFVLEKSLFSEQEQDDILASLQGLSAIETPDVEPVLVKLAAMFGKKRTAWLDVDFSHWGGGIVEREKFALLKKAILRSEAISFDYFNTEGIKTTRTAEPLKLLFKGQGWYLYAFCRLKADYRIFKLSRIKNLSLAGDTFSRTAPELNYDEIENPYVGKMQTLKLKIDAAISFRVYDEFEESCITKDKDGSFIVTITIPVSDWVYGYVLSYAGAAEVLEPPEMRTEIAARLQKMLEHYW